MPASTTLFARLRRAAQPLMWLCILLMLAEVAFATACAESEGSGDAVVVSTGVPAGDGPSCWDPSDCHCPCAHITALVPVAQVPALICSVQAERAPGLDVRLSSMRPDTLLRPPKV
jgi:hypothetical protein